LGQAHISLLYFIPFTQGLYMKFFDCSYRKKARLRMAECRVLYYIGRISGARRRKPGYPLQFLSPCGACGISASIPCAFWYGRPITKTRSSAGNYRKKVTASLSLPIEPEVRTNRVWTSASNCKLQVTESRKYGILSPVIRAEGLNLPASSRGELQGGEKHTKIRG
jgi:hypothetical protein